MGVKRRGVRNREPKVAAIIQARMGSTRLPNKVLLDLAGHPLIWHVIKRTQRAKRVDCVVVATTTQKRDSVLAQIAHRAGAEIFRGSESDVLERYWQACQSVGAEIVVRVTGDSPLLDPENIDRLLECHLSGTQDYTHDSLPPGLGAGVMWAHVLKIAHTNATLPDEREHVSPYIFRHRELFRIVRLGTPPEYHIPGLRLTVDTLEDYELIMRIYERLHVPDEIVDLRAVLSLLDAEPQLLDSVRDVKRKDDYLDRLFYEDYIPEWKHVESKRS